MNRMTVPAGLVGTVFSRIAVAVGVGLIAACGGGEPDPDGGGSAGGLGPLHDAVTIGAKNDWMHSFDSGTYRMENRGDPTNVRYFFVSSPDEHHGSRSVEVRVQVEGSPEGSRAGLIYGLRHEPRRYYAIVTRPVPGTNTPPEERGQVFREVDRRASNGTGGSQMRQARIPDVQYYPVRDTSPGRTNGMIMLLQPWPADWVLDEDPNASVAVEGPRGVRVYPTQSQVFAWSPDPSGRQYMAQRGFQLKPVASIAQILEQEIRPSAAARGSQLVRTHPVPEVEAFWLRYKAGVANSGSRRQVRSLGTEWTDGRGTKSFISILLYVSEQPPVATWVLETNHLEAPAGVYADAKADFLYSLGTTPTTWAPTTPTSTPTCTRA